MRHYGIIGNPLGHSYSARLFSDLFAREKVVADYALCPLDSLDKLPDLLHEHHLSGMSVTIPYKQRIIPLLDNIDPVAQQIGAVNVVAVGWTNNRYHLTGYNTDWSGFLFALRPLLAQHSPIEQALVLGTGGAARAVVYALNHIGIHPTLVSRNPDKGLTYADLTADTIQAHRLIVNCTPLGMSPHTQACPDLPYHAIGSQHILFDCIYNPAETLFLRHGQEQGAATLNGMTMLKQQAWQAWQLFQHNQTENQPI